MLLEWSKDLIKEADRTTGSTRLFTSRRHGAADPSAAYQPDSNGSFPIHLAAFAGKVKAISVLLDTGHDCAELLDTKGRTFLHVAVIEKSQSVVRYACKRRKFAASVLNMQDVDGNTALHYAIEIGDQWIFNQLMRNRFVTLNLANNEGETPLDLSWSRFPGGIIHYRLHPIIRIHSLLQVAGARNGTHRCDLFYKERRLDKKEEVQKITTYTQIVAIGSVLIATVAFAAAFTLPGGYRGDDLENGGTPMLVGRSAFHVFIIANTFTFIFSSLSITLLIYAGTAKFDLRSRMATLVFADALMAGSARSLSTAFGFGLYVVLAPAARTTAVASFAITALAFADAVWLIWVVFTTELMLLKRLGARAWMRLPRAILGMLFRQFWPYIVIAGVVKCVKIKRDH